MFLLAESSTSASNATVIDNREAGPSLHVMTGERYTIRTSGYLVAWQYYAGRTSDACESYADIFRETRETEPKTYQLISQTHLTGNNTTRGGRFQYITNEVIRVKVGDYLGFHVIKSNDCVGNLISFSPNGPGDRIQANLDAQSPPLYVNRLEINQTITGLTSQQRAASLRAYVAGKKLLDLLFSFQQDSECGFTLKIFRVEMF